MKLSRIFLNQPVAGLLVAAALVTGLMTAPTVQAVPSVDINTASVSELTELPGIGPAKAAAIVEERSVAPFKSVDDLSRVRGIGESTIDDLRGQVRVSKRKPE